MAKDSYLKGLEYADSEKDASPLVLKSIPFTEKKGSMITHSML
jgi:hypothetical protein